MLFESLLQGTVLFCTYQNSRCVVCGRHQNPWREFDLPSAKDESVPILRRITGGGAVYHDLGNLVFSFAMKRNLLDRSQNLRIVKKALAACGIEAELTEGFDLYSGGSKISGSAFRFRHDRGIHHGTLLVDSDRALMGRTLRHSESSIESFAVRSRPASTINLSELGVSCSIDEIKTQIEHEVAEYFRPITIETRDVAADADEEIDKIVERLTSWEWIYGNTPPFEISLGADSPILRLRVKKGRIEAVVSHPGEEANALVGCRLIKEEMLDRDVGERVRLVVERSTLL